MQCWVLHSSCTRVVHMLAFICHAENMLHMLVSSVCARRCSRRFCVVRQRNCVTAESWASAPTVLRSAGAQDKELSQSVYVHGNPYTSPNKRGNARSASRAMFASTGLLVHRVQTRSATGGLVRICEVASPIKLIILLQPHAMPESQGIAELNITTRATCTLPDKSNTPNTLQHVLVCYRNAHAIACTSPAGFEPAIPDASNSSASALQDSRQGLWQVCTVAH